MISSMSGKKDDQLTEEKIALFGGKVILFIELFVLAVLLFLSLFICYLLIRNMILTIDLGMEIVKVTDIIVNDVFMLIIMAELIRFILALRSKPRGRVVWLAEVGLIVSIREVIVASISKEAFNLLLSAIASLVLALVIWIGRMRIPIPYSKSESKCCHSNNEEEEINQVA